MNASGGSATHVPNHKRDYDNTVQMRFFVMHGTAKRDEPIMVNVNPRALGAGENPKRRYPCVSCSASRS